MWVGVWVPFLAVAVLVSKWVVSSARIVFLPQQLPLYLVSHLLDLHVLSLLVQVPVEAVTSELALFRLLERSAGNFAFPCQLRSDKVSLLLSLDVRE
jgi:hypothetical protein